MFFFPHQDPLNFQFQDFSVNIPVTKSFRRIGSFPRRRSKISLRSPVVTSMKSSFFEGGRIPNTYGVSWLRCWILHAKSVQLTNFKQSQKNNFSLKLNLGYRLFSFHLDKHSDKKVSHFPPNDGGRSRFGRLRGVRGSQRLSVCPTSTGGETFVKPKRKEISDFT